MVKNGYEALIKRYSLAKIALCIADVSVCRSSTARNVCYVIIEWEIVDYLVIHVVAYISRITYARCRQNGRLIGLALIKILLEIYDITAVKCSVEYHKFIDHSLEFTVCTRSVVTYDKRIFRGKRVRGEICPCYHSLKIKIK